MTLFDPSPVFIAFIFVKKFVYLELLLILALVRTASARGPARLAAAASLLLAAAGVATIFAPALGLTGSALYVRAAQALVWGSGMAALLAASGPLVLSAFLPGTRWRWVDALHLALLAGLVALWLATLF